MAAGLLLLGACASPPGAKPLALDLIGKAPTLGIQVSFAASPRRVLTLPSSWTKANFTLSSSTLLTGDRQQSISSAMFNGGGAPSSAVVLFPAARPGSYTLFASLSANSVVRALGASAVTLTAGAATSVTIALRTLPNWTANTLVSSTGTPSFSGDGGPPLSATLNGPRGLAIGGDGSVYVTDAGNNRVRKVSAGGGSITTIAGDGSTASLNVPRALAYDAAHDVLFIADSQNARIRLVTGASSAPVLSATSLATSGHPQALAYAYNPGTGNEILYVAEDNHVVEQIANPRTTPSTTVLMGSAGTRGNTPGTANALNVLLNSPQGLALDVAGTTLFVADTGNRCIRQADLTSVGFPTSILAGTGAGTSAGDGGRAASASFLSPADLAYDAADGGRLYVLDAGAAVVRGITLGNQLIATVFGTGRSAYAGDGGNAQLASLLAPSGMGFGNGGLYLAESGNNGHRVRSGL